VLHFEPAGVIDLHRSLGGIDMDRKSRLVGILVAACFATATLLMPSLGRAQADPRVQKSMELLKSMTATLGAPKVDGKEAVGGNDAPALHFGTTKMNNNFEVVDAIGKEDGKGMTATLFVKWGDEYIRVATNVPKPAILGVPYTTGYEPIKDSSGNAIGIYYVGYKK